jgi:hypothetical protein
MAEGDYGISLPITVHGTELGGNDSLRVTIKTRKNGETILEKNYFDIEDNTVELELTQTESAKLPVGVYVYSLDWYQNGIFMCNIVLCSLFKVVDKA